MAKITNKQQTWEALSQPVDKTCFNCEYHIESFCKYWIDKTCASPIFLKPEYQEVYFRSVAGNHWKYDGKSK